MRLNADSPLRRAERVEVIRVGVVEGKGTEDDPKRLVAYFFDLDGQALAKHDEWLEEQKDQ